MITVTMIEDHRILVDSLSLMLRYEPDIDFLGSAASLENGRRLLQETSPNVLLLDVGLPDGNGLDLIPEVKQISPDTNIVVLTSLTDETTLMRVVDSGISGFVSKDSQLSDLLVTIRKAAEGEIVMPTSLLVGLLMRMSRDKAAAYQDDKGWERLTVREEEVLERLASGKTGDEIAEELHIAPLTVRTHIRNLMSKMGVHSRLEAVAFGMKNGLIDPPA
ncbi:MAG TPA: response regulator transcription factor [Anaerolineales bacterium]|nr:response regulator transcription factor [Anaerolineales bacterium]